MIENILTEISAKFLTKCMLHRNTGSSHLSRCVSNVMYILSGNGYHFAQRRNDPILCFVVAWKDSSPGTTTLSSLDSSQSKQLLNVDRPIDIIVFPPLLNSQANKVLTVYIFSKHQKNRLLVTKITIHLIDKGKFIWPPMSRSCQSTIFATLFLFIKIAMKPDNPVRFFH